MILETPIGIQINDPHNPLRWTILLLSGFVSPLLLALFKDHAGFPRSNGGRTLRSDMTPLTSISPPAKLVVHVTSPYMTTTKPPHQGFRLSNVETCMSSGFTIPQIPMRSLCTSSPGWAPGPYDRYPRDRILTTHRGFKLLNSTMHWLMGFSICESPMNQTSFRDFTLAFPDGKPHAAPI